RPRSRGRGRAPGSVDPQEQGRGVAGRHTAHRSCRPGGRHLADQALAFTARSSTVLRTVTGPRYVPSATRGSRPLSRAGGRGFDRAPPPPPPLGGAGGGGLDRAPRAPSPFRNTYKDQSPPEGRFSISSGGRRSAGSKPRIGPEKAGPRDRARERVC